MPSASEYTGSNRILAAVPDREFTRYFSGLEPIEFSIREVLQDAAQPVKCVYFIEEGVASTLTVMANGAMIEVGMTGTEGLIGIAALLHPDAASLQVIMQIPGRALKMPLALCKTAFDESATIRDAMLRFATYVLSLSAQTAACNRLHSVEQRCARWLLMAYDRAKSETMPMTHEFLASMLGVRRAGVSTTAGELQRAGLISYRQRSVTIRDLDGLMIDLACECYALDHERLGRML